MARIILSNYEMQGRTGRATLQLDQFPPEQIAIVFFGALVVYDWYELAAV